MTGEPWDTRQIFVRLQSKSCCWSKSALFQAHVKRAFSTDWGQVGAAGEGRTIPLFLAVSWQELLTMQTQMPSHRLFLSKCALHLIPSLRWKFWRKKPLQNPKQGPVLGGWSWPRCALSWHSCTRRIPLGTSGLDELWHRRGEMFVTALLNGEFLRISQNLQGFFHLYWIDNGKLMSAKHACYPASEQTAESTWSERWCHEPAQTFILCSQSVWFDLKPSQINSRL